jgi:threonyl-tRNA synthetase
VLALGCWRKFAIAFQLLKQLLEKHFPGQWVINPGEGAFYGPKIDISLRDALRRNLQCATIQLDFQLSQRFGLKYRTAEEAASDEKEPSRPVIIHRAIFGSLERFIGIVTEHFGGKWCVFPTHQTLVLLWNILRRPFWLSPRQVLVVPVAVPYKDYAAEIANRLSALGFFADVDNGDNTLSKKIRNGEVAQYNFILGMQSLLAC